MRKKTALGNQIEIGNSPGEREDYKKSKYKCIDASV